MPIYQMKCTNSHSFDKVMSIAEMEQGKTVCDCGAAAEVQIVPTMIAPMFQPYRCPITEKPITTLQQHTENLKKHGCRIYEPGETADARRAAKAADMQLDKSIEQTAEAFVENLPGSKREQLGKELETSDTVYKRSIKGE